MADHDTHDHTGIPGVGGGLTHTTQGTTTDGGSYKTARGLYLKQIVLASDGLVPSVTAWVKGDGSNPAMAVPVVYTDSAGVPVNLINGVMPNITATPTRVNAVILNTTSRAMRFPLGIWLAAGTYWFGVWLSAGADSRILLAYASGAGATNYVDASAAQNEPVDISIAAGSTTTDNLSIYIDVIR